MCIYCKPEATYRQDCVLLDDKDAKNAETNSISMQTIKE